MVIFVLYEKHKPYDTRTASPGRHKAGYEGQGHRGHECHTRQILLFKTSEGGSKEVTDGDILNMIRKLVKQRKEAAEQYTAAGRQELADNELAEAAVLEKYLPKQLSAEEVKAKVQEIIAQVGATSLKDMGKVMGAANKALAGLSDGRTISTVVKELLG